MSNGYRPQDLWQSVHGPSLMAARQPPVAFLTPTGGQQPVTFMNTGTTLGGAQPSVTFMNTGTQLGLIPDWQFSSDPKVNALLNANVYTPTAGMRLMPAPLPPAMSAPPSLQGFNLPIIDSWWWQHRKPLVYGALGLVGVAVIVTLTSVLR